MAGALKTLFGALQASAYMTGISLVYGEEEVHDQSQALPMVVMVPLGGQYREGVGYKRGVDYTTEMLWGINTDVDLYLWGYDATPGATAIDHVDATETLRLAVLSALQDQRAQLNANGDEADGLYYKPTSERWQQMQGAFVRYGRALVITVTAEITAATAPPPFATITSEVINKTFLPAGP